MLYNTNMTKRTQQGYEQAVMNIINQEQSTGDCRTVQTEQQLSIQNKNIKVVLEFPTVANEKAEEEFKDFLKGLYLKKFEIGSMQREPQALKSSPTGGKPENNTKEGNSHE